MMSHYRKFMIVFFCFVLVLALPFSAAAQEAISPGDSVEGELDQDTFDYTFTAEAGELYLIAMNSDEFDTLLEVYDENGFFVDRDDDGGDGTNALLAFIPAEDGVYTIRATSFMGAGVGAYTLTLTVVELRELTYDEMISIKFDDQTVKYFAFEGSAGDVVNIIVESDGSVDTDLTLRGPDGFQLAYNDDFDGVDPTLYRTLLDMDGRYLLELGSYSRREIAGEVTLIIETTELLSLDDGPQVITLGESLRAESLVFEGAANSDYRLTISSNELASLFMNINQDGLFVASMNFDNIREGSFVFNVPVDGPVVLSINDGSFFALSDKVIEVRIEAVE